MPPVNGVWNDEARQKVGSQPGDAPKDESQRDVTGNATSQGGTTKHGRKVGNQLGDAPKDKHQRDVTGVVTSQPDNHPGAAG